MPKTKEPARTGRPPIAAEDRRDRVIKVLASEAEFAELQRAATAARRSVSMWVREAALEKAGTGTDSK